MIRFIGVDSLLIMCLRSFFVSMEINVLLNVSMLFKPAPNLYA